MSSPYLRRATRGWQFRRAVPQSLRKRFRRTEIVRSLARISQHQAVVRAKALGTACEALFMFVEQHATLTADEIGRVTDLYIRNQTALFEMRLDDLPRGFRPLRQALREKATIRREMMEETALTIRKGGELFSDPTIAALAEDTCSSLAAETDQ